MTPRPVLLATDLSEGARRAAEVVRSVMDPGAAVHVVHVVPLPPYVSALGRSDREALERASEATTSSAEREVQAWAAQAGFPDAAVRVLRGDVPRILAQEAATLDVGLLAMGSHGMSAFERALLGSTVRATLRRIHGRDALVARSGGALPPRRVLVATDFGGASDRAARVARRIASRHNAELVLAHVVDPAGWQLAYDPRGGPAPEGFVRGAVERMLEEQSSRELGGAARTLLLHGRPAVELAEAARSQDADLVVVGSHGAGAVERALLGSVAEGVVERSPVSVLVVGA